METTSEETYRRLAAHLDTLPGGFAPSSTGADRELLARLFTPDEAELAIHLTLHREATPAIAARVGLPLPQTEERLEAMAHKGLIFAVRPPDGPALYQAAPFVVGIYEFQVGSLSPELLQLLEAYWDSIAPRRRGGVPQMRTIPVRQRIDRPVEALPYECIDELLRTHSQYAVAPCICRRRARLLGQACRAPEEACLLFDEWAEFYVHNNEGRFASLDEVRQIVARADDANLVLQPSNSRKVAFVCCCCPCCCGVLRSMKAYPQPARIVASPFVARLVEATCDDCRRCLERCPMDALHLADDRVLLDQTRCIGCGLCASTCPTGALSLERKPLAAQIDVPADMTATWQSISRAQQERAQARPGAA